MPRFEAEASLAAEAHLANFELPLWITIEYRPEYPPHLAYAVLVRGELIGCCCSARCARMLARQAFERTHMADLTDKLLAEVGFTRERIRDPGPAEPGE